MDWERRFYQWFLTQLLAALEPQAGQEQAVSETVMAPRADGQYTRDERGTHFTRRQSNLIPRPNQTIVRQVSIDRAFGDGTRISTPFEPPEGGLAPPPRRYPWASPFPPEAPFLTTLFLDGWRIPNLVLQFDDGTNWYRFPGHAHNRIWAQYDTIQNRIGSLGSANRLLGPNYFLPYASQLLEGVRSSWGYELPNFPGNAALELFTVYDNRPIGQWNDIPTHEAGSTPIVPYLPAREWVGREELAFRVVAYDLDLVASVDLLSSPVTGEDVIRWVESGISETVTAFGTAGSLSLPARKLTTTPGGILTGPTEITGAHAVQPSSVSVPTDPSDVPPYHVAPRYGATFLNTEPANYVGPSGLTHSISNVVWHGPRVAVDTRARLNPETGVMQWWTRCWHAVYVTYDWAWSNDFDSGAGSNFDLVGFASDAHPLSIAFTPVVHYATPRSGSGTPVDARDTYTIASAPASPWDELFWWYEWWSPPEQYANIEWSGSISGVTWPDERVAVGDWSIWNPALADVGKGMRLAGTTDASHSDGHLYGRVLTLYEGDVEAYFPPVLGGARGSGFAVTGAVDPASFASFATGARIMYDGDLGQLPRPFAGGSTTFCGLTIDATGQYSADALLRSDAVIVGLAIDAALDVRMSVDGELAWEGPLADLLRPAVATDLEGVEPLAHQRFLHPGWPHRTCVLRVSDVYLVFRERQQDDRIAPGAPLVMTNSDFGVDYGE